MQRRQGLIGRSSFENVSNRINTSLGHFSRADLGHSWRAPEYRRDRRKDALLQRHGMWVLRVLAEDVALRIDEVLDHVLSAVRPRQAEMLEG